MEPNQITICPCRNCPNRTVTCHSECELYKTWSTQNELIRKKRYTVNYQRTLADESIIQRRMKRKKS